MKPVLPKSVVSEDRKLEKATDSASRALMELRWHWTLDASNPKRVSLREYARQVGKSDKTVRAYANGYVLLAEGGDSLTPSEAMERANMGAETAAATEAVAEARGLSVGHARQSRPVEVRRVREIARERAEAQGTSVEDEAPKVADWIARSEKAEEQRLAKRRGALGLRYVEIESELVGAKRRLLNALEIARVVEWESEHQELLSDTVDSVRSLLALIDVALAGAANVDWDAELAKLTE